MSSTRILALDTGLFGDAAKLKAALAELDVSRIIDLRQADLSDAEWDDVLKDILAAGKIVTI